VAQIAASIKEFGFTNPILTDGDNGIIAGHGRLLAARKLGLDTVPAIELSHLTENQRKAYIIADNKLALNADWDMEMLSLEMGDLRDEGFDLSLIGFGDIENILGGDGPLPIVKEFDAEDFSEFAHQCPKCGFEFDAKE